MHKYVILLLFFNAYFLIAKEYESLKEGQDENINERIYIIKKNNNYFSKISSFYNIPLYPGKAKDIVNMVIEIPKGQQIKREINKEIYLNPITPDIKDKKIRKVIYQGKNQPKPGYPYHYGALPQTWEHLGQKDPHTGLFGDNDPIDAFDISLLPRKVGDIIQVKILGAVAMIDNNETDWKLIVINTKDPRSKRIHDIDNVNKNIIDIIHDFLENYKTPDGKPKNTFFHQVFWHKKETLNIVKEMHENYIKLCHYPDETKMIIEKNRPERLHEIPKCSINI